MYPQKLLEEIINEHGSATILRERLLLLGDEIERLEKEKAELKNEVRELSNKNQQLTAELETYRSALETYRSAEELINHQGALFKCEGKDIWTVYCPACKISAFPFPAGEHYSCNCGWASTFTENDMPMIVKELNDDPFSGDVEPG